MAQKCRADLVRGDPFSVVCDTDQAHASVSDLHCERRRPCVDRILAQFLNDGTRPLDYLARSDLVDNSLVQKMYQGHVVPLQRICLFRFPPVLKSVLKSIDGVERVDRSQMRDIDLHELIYYGFVCYRIKK